MIQLNLPSFSDSKEHLFCDQVEIYLAFFHQDDSISKCDIQALVDKEVDSISGASDDSEETIYSELGQVDSVESDIVIEGKAAICYSHIEGRCESFGEFYPFSLDDGRVIKPETFTDKQRLYLFLLQSSSLNLIDQKSDSLILANKFESICAKGVSNWLIGSEVREFGPTSEDRRTIFGSNTRNALVQLASFINATPQRSTIFKKRVSGEYQVHTSGDKGLDIVARLPFVNDSALGAFSILGQCASRKEHWWHKKYEADPIELDTYMHFNNKPLNMVFIPVCFRDSDGSWYDEGKASGGCLVVDRVRLCSMFCTYEGGFDFLPELASAA